MKQFILMMTVFLIITGCDKNYKPRPKAYLALDFPPHQYRESGISCPYAFELNKTARIVHPDAGQPCMINIDYPALKGTVYMTYESVHDNLRYLIEDAQKLPLKHTIKADEITGDEYVNEKHRTYGMLYTVTGDAASQVQFYLTDSLHHFLTGSVYFRRSPNYDSIYPAAVYLKTDIVRLMESLEWKN